MEGEGTSSKEETPRKLKRICVFCGSSPGFKTSFTEAALELGQELVKRKIDLVYGGGSVGLMGLISKTVFDGGCHVLGRNSWRDKVVADMHQRKSTMAENADAFIALPGGYGTLEELLEMITWSQLGIHDNPVGLLNVDGYYNSLLTLFDKGVDEGFIKVSERKIMVSAVTVQDLITKIEEYVTVHRGVVPKQNWKTD